MHPILFTVFGISVYSHPFFIGLGLIAAILVCRHETVRLGMDRQQMLSISMGALLGGGLGARLSAVWRYGEAVVANNHTNHFTDYLLYGGRSILGGLAGAYIGAMITKRLIGYKGETGNAFAPAVALGMAIGRVGCFLTEQVGTITSMPWGIRLDPGVGAQIPACPDCISGKPLHPSFIYEIIFHLAAFAVLWWYRPRAKVQGEMFKAYCLSYLIFRFLVEFVRGADPLWLGLTRSQLFCVPAALLMARYFVSIRARMPLVEKNPPKT